MRSFFLAVTLGIGCCAALCSTPQDSEAHGRRSYGYTPCPSAYYAPPVYYPAPVYRQPPSYSPYTPSYRPAQPTTLASVGVYDNYFEPKTINVLPGTTVRWVNYGTHVHTVTANDSSWDSGDLPPGASYAVTFAYPGTYYYNCRHHTKERMQGTITVGRGGGSGSGYGSSGY